MTETGAGLTKTELIKAALTVKGSGLTRAETELGGAGGTGTNKLNETEPELSRTETELVGAETELTEGKLNKLKNRLNLLKEK